MLKSYTLHCVHKGDEHWLNTAYVLKDVKVNRFKVLTWMLAMGIELDNDFTTLLVIRENGVPILRAPFGPTRHAWRPYACLQVADEATVGHQSNP